MRNYLLDGSEKLLEPTIFFNLNTKFKYLFAIKLCFRKSLAQERLTSIIEIRYQVLLSTVKKKFFKSL